MNTVLSDCMLYVIFFGGFAPVWVNLMDFTGYFSEFFQIIGLDRVTIIIKLAVFVQIYLINFAESSFAKQS